MDPAASPFAWTEHDRAQNSIYSSSAYLRAFGLLQNTQIVRVAMEGQLQASLAVQLHRRSAHLLGAFTVSAALFEPLSTFLFDRFRELRYVRSDLLVRDLQLEGHPGVHAIARGDDLFCALPAAPADFEAGLEKEHLKRIKYYERRFAREFPAARALIQQGGEIAPDVFRSVVEFNRERMSAKGSVSGVDGQYEQRMVGVARSHGTVVLLMNHEDLVAGSVLFRTSKHAYLWMISHNAKYEKYSPGILCLYVGFRHLIEQGVENYHLLWGDSAYKRHFGAVRNELRSYAILRKGCSRRELIPLLLPFYQRELRSLASRSLKKYKSVALGLLKKRN